MKALTLSNRLFRLQMVLAGVCLLITWILITTNDFFIFRDLSLQKFETTAKILSRNLSTCLVFRDAEECSRVLSSLDQETSVLAAAAEDETGKVIASYKNYPGRKHFLLTKGKYEYVIRDSRIYVAYPIVENGQFLGRLYLLAEFDIARTFGIRHALMFLVILAVTLLVVVRLSSVLQRKVALQIQILLRTMQNVRRQKNYHVRLRDEDDWADVDVQEFRELGETFDSMIEEVERRDLSLKKHNVDLEKVIEVKVQEVLRNAELASLGEMAGGIAHEINNPLTIINSTSKVLRKLLDREKFNVEAFRSALGDIEETVDRIAKIVVGLRNISRKAEDKDVAPGCWDEVFGDVFEVAESRFRSKGVEIRKSFSADEAKFIFSGNRIQLSQVLVNLLNNSFDAIVELPQDVKWIDIQIRKTESDVRLQLVDCGPGIPAKVREKMFNPFFTTKEIGKGTGIGLAISKSMVEKMGGTLVYDESSPNTSFIISLKAG